MDFDPKETDVKYCGIDLHSNNSVVIVSEEKDWIVRVSPFHGGQFTSVPTGNFGYPRPLAHSPSSFRE